MLALYPKLSVRPRCTDAMYQYTGARNERGARERLKPEAESESRKIAQR